MPYDGSGNFTRSYNWTTDKNAAIKIRADRIDGQDDEFATAFNEVLLRNGVAPLTGDLKFGGNNITGLGDGTVSLPALSPTGDTATGLYFPAASIAAITAGGVEGLRVTDVGSEFTGLVGFNTPTPRTDFDFIGIISLSTAFEDAPLVNTAITGAVNVDAKTSSIIMYEQNCTGNFTFNIRGSSTEPLDTLMGVGQSMTFAIEVPQGSSAFYCTAITIDGLAPDQIKWFAPGAPSFGNPSGIDVYTITVIKTDVATFYVRASLAQVT